MHVRSIRCTRSDLFSVCYFAILVVLLKRKSGDWKKFKERKSMVSLRLCHPCTAWCRVCFINSRLCQCQVPSESKGRGFYAFYAFYEWWIDFLQSGALAEGTSRPVSHKHDQAPLISMLSSYQGSSLAVVTSWINSKLSFMCVQTLAQHFCWSREFELLQGGRTVTSGWTREAYLAHEKCIHNLSDAVETIKYKSSEIQYTSKYHWPYYTYIYVYIYVYVHTHTHIYIHIYV